MNGLRFFARASTRNICMYRRSFSSDVYEPPYLDALKPAVPLYDAINVEVRGYDYAILESYQALIHSIAKEMDIDVEEGWALPPQAMQITTLKPNSEVINSQYNLKTYRRSVQLNDVFTTQLPSLLRAIEACTPVGVSVKVEKHEFHHEEERYIPDKDLLSLKQELDEMGAAKKTK